MPTLQKDSHGQDQTSQVGWNPKKRKLELHVIQEKWFCKLLGDIAVSSYSSQFPMIPV